MIKIKRSKDNQFYFVVVAKNGKVWMQSEMYKRKSTVKKQITNFILSLYDLVDGFARDADLELAQGGNIIDETK